jgi:Tfp pilus assembly protein PilW
VIPSRNTRAACAGERGTSLVELLVATSIGLSLAALLGHTVTAYQAHYHHAVTRMNGDQQAQFALALMADELETLLAAPASATCPAGGVHIVDGRVEFAANLYDRATSLREDAPAGRNEVVVASVGWFEAGDLVMVVNVNDPTDPGDDVADCARITAISEDQWTLAHALARSFSAGSQVTLVNRVTYALDRLGRLMRTQDGGTQRIAQDVVAFDVRLDGAALLVRLAVRHASEWSRRIGVEDAL